MNQLSTNTNDEIVMKLLSYFVTEKEYSPIVIRGVQGEIWLENLSEDYKIVRIVSNYIHNNEQLEFDLTKTRHLMKTIRKKTFSLNLNALSIFVNLGSNVEMEKYDNNPRNILAYIKDTEDLRKYSFIINTFPDITKKMTFSEKGMELFMKITENISKKNEGVAKMNEEVFSMKKPFITYFLIAINIIMFLLTVFTNIINIESLAVYKYGVLIGEYYRLFTGMFLHANIWHLAFNCYALYIIGIQLESFIGKAKYLSVYILSGIAGSALSIFFSDGFSVGASGAIFGLLGSLIYFGYHYRIYLESVVKSQIIPLVIINLFIGMMPGIDNWAHIGGLIGGVLATMALGIKYKSTNFERINGTIIYLIYVGAILFLVFNPSILGQ